MNSTSDTTMAKGPNRLMVFSSVLMVLGSLLTAYILINEALFISRNPGYQQEPDMLAALITIILLVLEIRYAVSVLLAKWRNRPCEPLKMKNLAALMLVLNCVLFIWCYICMRFFEGWTTPGYFTLADIIAFSSLPGIFVKILAQEGASRFAASLCFDKK